MNKTFVGNVARDSLLYGNVTQEEFKRTPKTNPEK
jgi:hypothetical protein